MLIILRIYFTMIKALKKKLSLVNWKTTCISSKDATSSPGSLLFRMAGEWVSRHFENRGGEDSGDEVGKDPVTKGHLRDVVGTLERT